MKGMRLIIIILGALVIITAIALIVVRLTANNESNTNSNTNTVTNTNAGTNANTVANVNSNTNATPANVNTNPVAASGTDEASLRAIARSFAERFGTYSNHSDYENIEHLIPYMSLSMTDWAEQYVADQRESRFFDDIYSGVTTKSLSVETIEYDEGEGVAEFNVNTQRKEATGSTSNAHIYYQEVRIRFVNEQSVWKVDEALWQ